MALFGKKSNQRSGNSDVPPELKPYYSGGSGSASVRRSALRVILGLLVIAIVVAAGTASWRYVQNHKTQIALQTKTNQTQPPQTPSTTTQKSTPNKTTTQTPPSRTGSQPDTTAPATSGTQQAPEQNQSAPSSGTPSTPSSTSQTTTPQTQSQSSTLTNTGPGETAVIAALVAGFLAMLVHYRRQARSRRL